MAIYHLSAQLIKRSEGRSAVACAAYRAGVALRDERTGESFDYSRRRTHIESCIMLPLGSPPELLDRATLWNAVEAAEKRRDAQLSRELVVALPVELSRDEQGALVEDFVSKLVETTGVGADVSIHDSGDGNPHAHIMMTLRTIDAAGLSPKKNRALNSPAMLMEWRKDWAEATNWALAQAGRSERIDHRSHADRGLKSPPTVHLGVAAAAMERRGIPTRLGDHNRAAIAAATELHEARRHVEALTLFTQLIEKARAWSRRRLELRAARERRRKAAQQQKQTREDVLLARFPLSSSRPGVRFTGPIVEVTNHYAVQGYGQKPPFSYVLHRLDQCTQRLEQGRIYAVVPTEEGRLIVRDEAWLRQHSQPRRDRYLGR